MIGPVMAIEKETEARQSQGLALFDRRLVARHRVRAEADFSRYGFLFTRAAAEIADRLSDFNRRFARVLVLGNRGSALRQAIGDDSQAAARLDLIIECDLDPRLVPAGGVCLDEEALPFASESFDLAVSLLGFHAVNDLPGALIQISRALKPDGLLIAAMFGGDTLCELRQALAEAEIEIEGGLSPRVFPFATLEDAAALLQRAGLALPVIDRDRLTVSYETPLDLLRDLRGMGETNSLVERRRQPLRRATLARACALYQQWFGDGDGRVTATFEIFYLTGWAPHESQQKPLAPGSARIRLADALGASQRAGKQAAKQTDNH